MSASVDFAALGFGTGVAGLLGLATLGLVLTRRALKLDTFWYALAALGAAAAVAATVAAMGVWLTWVWLAPVPAVLPRVELVARADVLIATTLLVAIFVELAKSYGVTLFHTRLNRGMWPVFGAAVGVGAGMLEAFWALAPSVWTLGWGMEVAETRHFWLIAQHGALIALEAACGALVLYETARDRRWLGVLEAGGLHGAALLTAALIPQLPSLDFGHSWLPTGALVGAATLAAAWVVAMIKHRGWPA